MTEQPRKPSLVQRLRAGWREVDARGRALDQLDIDPVAGNCTARWDAVKRSDMKGVGRRG